MVWICWVGSATGKIKNNKNLTTRIICLVSLERICEMTPFQAYIHKLLHSKDEFTYKILNKRK